MFWPAGQASHSIPPELTEPPRSQLGVSHSVLDVPMPHVMLYGPRIVSLVRQVESAGMPQHVRMDREANPGHGSRSGHQLADGGGGKRSLALTAEDVWTARIVTLQATQCPQLRAPKRVRAVSPSLEAANI
jgi:hypothetical protein